MVLGTLKHVEIFDRYFNGWNCGCRVIAFPTIALSVVVFKKAYLLKIAKSAVSEAYHSPLFNVESAVIV